jgi:exopolysaccharide production protein ExoZ
MCAYKHQRDTNFLNSPLQSSKYATLELGRFIAAFLVMSAHVIAIVNGHFAHHGQHIFGGWSPPRTLPVNIEGFVNYTGELAVQFFFVLSGFVMATAHRQDFGRLSAVPNFWWRRACRIYPTYWLALLLTICTIPAAWTFSSGLQNIFLYPWCEQNTLFIAWTLRCEIMFYMLFGLCLLPWIGKPLLVLWVGLCLWEWCPQPVLQTLHIAWPSLTMRLLPIPGNRIFSYLNFYFFADLAAGGAAAWPRLELRLGIACIVTGVVLGIAILAPLHGNGPYAAPPTSVLGLAAAIAAIILGLAALERQAFLRPHPQSYRFGAVSYPLYVLHVPVVLLVIQFVPPRQFTTLALYGLGAAITALVLSAAALATLLFDQPVQRWLRWQRPRPNGGNGLKHADR